jgi:hypothetical protein
MTYANERAVAKGSHSVVDHVPETPLVKVPDTHSARRTNPTESTHNPAQPVVEESRPQKLSSLHYHLTGPLPRKSFRNSASDFLAINDDSSFDV